MSYNCYNFTSSVRVNEWFTNPFKLKAYGWDVLCHLHSLIIRKEWLIYTGWGGKEEPTLSGVKLRHSDLKFSALRSELYTTSRQKLVSYTKAGLRIPLSGGCSSVCSTLNFQSQCLNFTPGGSKFFLLPLLRLKPGDLLNPIEQRFCAVSSGHGR